jgi:hypothetical protein
LVLIQRLAGRSSGWFVLLESEFSNSHFKTVAMVKYLSSSTGDEWIAQRALDGSYTAEV